jgi:hypothetical protein
MKDNDELAAKKLIEELSKYNGMEKRVVVSSNHCNLLKLVRETTSYCTGACEREATLFAGLTILKVYLPWFWLFEDPPEVGKQTCCLTL